MTYKCLVWINQSSPGVVDPFETGIFPSSWFSAISNQLRVDKLPMDGGIFPVKALEFRDLQGILASMKGIWLIDVKE